MFLTDRVFYKLSESTLSFSFVTEDDGIRDKDWQTQYHKMLGDEAPPLVDGDIKVA